MLACSLTLASSFHTATLLKSNLMLASIQTLAFKCQHLVKRWLLNAGVYLDVYLL